MAVLDKKRTEMVQKLNSLINRLDRLFLNTYVDALTMLRTQIENGADFTWEDNPMVEKKIDKLIDLLVGKSNVIISDGVAQFQTYGTQSALDALRERARQIAEKYGNQKFMNRGVSDEMKALNKEATNQRRMDAVGGHSTTVAERGGKMNNLSNRVWSLNDQVKTEIEIIVQDSIKKGYSTEYAIKLAQKYLNNPNEIDAWKQDKNGEWYQTPAAKNYHPGRGVYKSAKKNVERMIRTETMAAYRTAEIEQYQKNAMVKGYRIQLSGNHTTTHGHHGVKKLKDICDRLQGDYPKTFVWTGWHPNCRCVLIPIMLTDAEFAEYLKAKRAGKLDEFSQKTNIQDIPEQMDDWMDENKKRIQETIDNPKKELPKWVDSVMKESDEYNSKTSFNGDSSLNNNLISNNNKSDNGDFEINNKNGLLDSLFKLFDIKGFTNKIKSLFDSRNIKLKTKTISSLGRKKPLLQININNNLLDYIFKINKTEQNEFVLDISYVVLNSTMQKRGITTNMINIIFDTAKKMGVKKVTLVAMLENGGLVWAKFDFMLVLDKANEFFSSFINDKSKQEYASIVISMINTYRKQHPDKKYYPMKYILDQKWGEMFLNGTTWHGVRFI